MVLLDSKTLETRVPLNFIISYKLDAKVPLTAKCFRSIVYNQLSSLIFLKWTIFNMYCSSHFSSTVHFLDVLKKDPGLQCCYWKLSNTCLIVAEVWVVLSQNSKSISVLGRSKSKSYFVYQYWACLKKVLKVWLASLGQDLGNTCRLIPKSKPTFRKISSENCEFKKILQRATILALLFGHFPGVL